jgi:hypothetical protein
MKEVSDGSVQCKHCGSYLNPATKQRPIADGDDFGAMFNNTFSIWKENLVDLAILTLVFCLVCWIPIVNIAFIAGYTRSLLKVARGEGRAAVGDLFNAWDCFGSLLAVVIVTFIIAILLNMIPVLGTLLSLALGFLVLPGCFLIIDQCRGISDALNWSIATIRADFINWLLAYLVGNFICGIGLILIVIGVLFSAPLGQLIIILQYERVKSTAA